MRRGLIDMMVAVTAFTLMLAMAKVGGAYLRPIEIVVWRGVLGATVLLPFVRGRALQVKRPWLLLTRTIFGASAMVCFYTSVQGLTISEASLIVKIQPILVAIGAPIVLGVSEKADRATWIALVLGFSGTAVLLAPEALSGSLFGLWAVAAAVLSSGAHLAVRELGKADESDVIVLWFQIGAATFAWAIGSALAGAPIGVPPVEAWPSVLGVAAFALTGQLFMTRAYQRAAAAPVAAMSYIGPLVALVVDVIVFGSVPGWTAAAGGVLVVSAGLVLLLGGLPTRARVAALWRPVGTG